MKFYYRYGSQPGNLGFPELGVIERESKDLLPLRAIWSADFVFYFKDEKTEYLKDRYAVNAQYTPEEKLSIALRAVPFSV